MKKSILLVSVMLSCLLTFATADAAMDIGLKGIGGAVGFVMPEGEADSTFGLGVIADLGTVMDQLRLEGSVDYWGDSWEAIGVETSWSTITVGGTVKYDIPMNGSFIPFAGGGAGLSISRWETEWTGATFWGVEGHGGSSSDSDMDLAFHFVGGVDVPVGSNMKATLQAKYVIDGYDALWLTGALLVQLY